MGLSLKHSSQPYHVLDFPISTETLPHNSYCTYIMSCPERKEHDGDEPHLHSYAISGCALSSSQGVLKDYEYIGGIVEPQEI